MGYLQPTEYTSYGLPFSTTDDWITTSSVLIDRYCRRASLNCTQYVERMRITGGSQSAHLSYLPLSAVAPATSPIVSVTARYARPRRGDLIDPSYEQVAWVFGLPGSWSTLDPASIDFVPNTGEIVFPVNILGLSYNEVEVTYTGGLLVIGEDIKTACAMIVKNAQDSPGLNVKSSQIDTMRIEYFGNDLMDAGVKSLLAPYVSTRMG